MILAGLSFLTYAEMRITTVAVEHFWEERKSQKGTKGVESQGGGQEQISLCWFGQINSFGL